MVDFDDFTVRFPDKTYVPPTSAAAGSDGKLRAPMDGRIVAIKVAAGERSSRGQTLIVLEAMKIQHQLKAALDAEVEFDRGAGGAAGRQPDRAGDDEGVMGGQKTMLRRRTVLASMAASVAAPALAQSFPAKQITLIVPFAAGGPTDVVARVMGERMGKELGQQFIIDNITGAAGTIAVGKAVRAAPDGYTVQIGHVGTNVANGTIYKNLNYNLLTDLVPIARLPQNPMLVCSSLQVPATSLKELVA